MKMGNQSITPAAAIRLFKVGIKKSRSTFPFKVFKKMKHDPVT